MALAESIVEGHKTLAASNTPEKLTTESPIITGMSVRANSGNAQAIRIGGSEVGASSYYLEPKDALSFNVIDPTKVYVYGHETDGVVWMGLAP